MMEPIVEALEEKYAGRITFIETMVSEDQESGLQLASEYRVQGSPTYLFLYSDGFEIGRLVGRQSQADMEAALELLLSR